MTFERMTRAAGALAFTLLASCEFGTAPGFVDTVPHISYQSPAVNTVSCAAVHPANATGGAISRFSVSPALPAGYTLDTLTGLIAGTPAAARTPVDYSVIATGPGGKDTASINLNIIAYDDVSEPGPGTAGSGVRVTVDLVTSDPVVLAKGSAVKLKKMVVTLTSNLGARENLCGEALA